MRYRSRAVPTPKAKKLIGSTYMKSGNNWVLYSNHYLDYVQQGRTYLSLEKCWDELHPGPPYRTGGPFSKWTLVDGGLEEKRLGTYIGAQSLNFKYIGSFYCDVRPATVFSSPYSIGDDNVIWQDWGEACVYGPTGWNRFRPGRPSASLAQFIAELRDLPRMLRTTAKFFSDLWRSMGGSRTSFSPKSVADHWLNTQFGWLPFISDLKKMYKTYKSLDTILSQLIRDNNRWIRRRGTVKKDESYEIWRSQSTTAHFPILTTYLYQPGGTGSHQIWQRKSQNIWFEGSFKYYIPKIGSVTWRESAIRQIYGLEITPSLVWELIPWSWLVDWFTNVGDVISNLCVPGPVENLVSNYAYVMGDTQWTYDVDSTLRLSGGPYTDRWSIPLRRKHRCKASPFGFGLTSTDFSLRQWSILAALGISRLQF